MLNIKATFAVVLVGSLSCFVGAQPHQGYSPVPYSPDTPVLKYRSNDAKKTWDWLSSLIESTPGKPDRYTPSSDARKWQDAVSSRIGSSGANKIVFVGACSAKYDPDRRRYIAGPYAYQMYATSSAMKLDGLWQFSIDSSYVSDTYRAENAFGSSVEVQRGVTTEYAIFFSPRESPPNHVARTGKMVLSTIHAFDQEIPMAPEKARQLGEKSMMCAYLISLKRPYVFTYERRIAPSNVSRYDLKTNGFAFFGSFDEVTVLNKDTGEVYARAKRK